MSWKYSTTQESAHFLFVLLPRWEETGTICPQCWPDGSTVDAVCICPKGGNA